MPLAQRAHTALSSHVSSATWLQALQVELAQRGEELVKFETLHKLIRSQLEARVTEAGTRAARLAARCRELRARQAHEMEGWAADVGQLRKRIAAVDRRLTQAALAARLPDDDRLDAALARHARCAVPTCLHDAWCPLRWRLAAKVQALCFGATDRCRLFAGLLTQALVQSPLRTRVSFCAAPAVCPPPASPTSLSAGWTS